jgi:hypothetical protein
VFAREVSSGDWEGIASRYVSGISRIMLACMPSRLAQGVVKVRGIRVIGAAGRGEVR